VLKDIGTVIDTVKEVKEAIYKAAGDKGSVNVQGRTLEYEITGGFHKWKFKYNGKAWDRDAQISVKSKGWKSQNGAREHVLEDLIAELRKQGFLK
jgi:hypothetical protein